MIDRTPLPSGTDVREIRMWLNSLADRVSRIESRVTGAPGTQTKPSNSSCVAPMIAVITSADPPKADIYRGETTDQAGEPGTGVIMHEGVDVVFKSDLLPVVGQRCLAFLVRGAWECFAIADGATGREADTFQVLACNDENELTWHGFPVITDDVEYVLAKQADGTIGWRATTDDCEDLEES